MSCRVVCNPEINGTRLVVEGELAQCVTGADDLDHRAEQIGFGGEYRALTGNEFGSKEEKKSL
jgi:hypothetical protein